MSARPTRLIALVLGLMSALVFSTLSPAQAVTQHYITGTVTAEGVVGVPLDDIGVTLYVRTHEADPGDPGDEDLWDEVDTNYTHGDGSYDFYVGDGVYKVLFTPDSGSIYIGEYWDNHEDFEDADEITMAGADVPNVNAALTRSLLITGTVKDSNGAEIQDVNVNAYSDNIDEGSQFADDETGVDGVYQLPVYADNPSYVCFSADGFADQCLTGKNTLVTADPVTVTTADVTRDVVLVSNHAVKGTVTGPGGLPIKGAEITLFTTSFPLDEVGHTTAKANGTYSLRAPPGDYKVLFSQEGYDEQWFNDEAYPGTTVTLLSTADTAGINAHLVASTTAPISGTVTAGGAPLAGIDVTAYYAGDENAVAAETSTSATGTYSLAVPTGASVKIYFSHPDGLYTPEFWNDEDDFDLATEVAAGSSTPVNAELSNSQVAVIRGKVTSDGTHGISGIEVTFFDQADDEEFSIATKADGTYAAGVTPDSDYKVRFTSLTGAYRQEFFDNVHSIDAATQASVHAGEEAVEDATLEATHAIKGHVSVPAGYSAKDVLVTAYPYNSNDEVTTNTDASGNYALGLEDDEYDLYFETDRQLLASRYYAVAPDSYTSVVLAGADQTGKDVTLQSTPGITGKVFMPNGAPVDAYAVVYRKKDGKWKRVSDQDVRSPDNSYAFQLDAGTYRLKFEDETNEVDPIFWDNAFTFGTSTEIVVGGAPVTGRDVYFGGRPVVTPPVVNPPVVIPPKYASSVSGSVKGGKKKATFKAKIRFANLKAKKTSGTLYVYEGARVVKKAKFKKGKASFKVKAKKGIHTYTVVFNGGANYGTKTFTRTVNVK